ncbi:MAG: glycosyltransferase family 2 protein [Erysipelotrichaceae bacterium]|nr:glycosyltransferase family 2 protein [Erysipelotrichaceae bacterium]
MGLLSFLHRKKEIKVSIIIPVYNAEKYIREDLDSLLGQSLREIEVICVDDGSKDSSLKILEDYQRRDARVRVLKQENKGAGAARNEGMKEAKGDYLIFLDADDFFEKDMLEKCVRKMEEEDADVLVFAADKYDDQNKTFLPTPWSLQWQRCPQKTPFSSREMPLYIFQAFQNWPWNKLFRRSYIERNGILFQEVKRSNDVAFVSTALAKAERITYLNEVFAHYRVNTGSSLQQSKDREPLVFLDAYRELKRRLVEADLYQVFEQSFTNKVMTTINFYADTYKTKEAKDILSDFLLKEGDGEFGISKHPEEYYYNKSEFGKYLFLLGKEKE